MVLEIVAATINCERGIVSSLEAPISFHLTVNVCRACKSLELFTQVKAVQATGSEFWPGTKCTP
jgi:hypothetical protein